MLDSSITQLRQAFDTKVSAWVQYIESFPGQLRQAEVSHHLSRHLPSRSLKVLDVGCGTGELSAALAAAGHSVTLLDFSPVMLAEAKRRCERLNATCLCAEASQVQMLFEPGTFDVVLCHSVLEFISNVHAIISQLAYVLQEGGVLSVLIGNRYHAPLRQALLEGDFDGAQEGLENEAEAIDLFGLRRHTLFPEATRQVIETNGLRVIGEYGVRVFSDLLASPPSDVERLLALELAAGPRLPYRYIARFVQFIAVKE